MGPCKSANLEGNAALIAYIITNLTFHRNFFLPTSVEGIHHICGQCKILPINTETLKFVFLTQSLLPNQLLAIRLEVCGYYFLFAVPHVYMVYKLYLDVPQVALTSSSSSFKETLINWMSTKLLFLSFYYFYFL